MLRDVGRIALSTVKRNEELHTSLENEALGELSVRLAKSIDEEAKR